MPIIYKSHIDLLTHAHVPVTQLATGYVALEIDVYPMINEKNARKASSESAR